MILKRNYYNLLILVLVICFSCNNGKVKKAQDINEKENLLGQSVDSSANFMLWGAPATEFNKEREIFLHAFVTTGTSGFPPSGDPPNYYYWYDAGRFWPTDGSIDSVYQIEKTRIGNLKIAEKINAPNDPRSLAGLVYGEEGVCHQIANRTTYATYWTGTGQPGMDPLKLPLTGYPGADSYIVTFLAYGVYGRNSTLDKPKNYDFKQRILNAGGDTSWVGNERAVLKKLLMELTEEKYSPEVLAEHLKFKDQIRTFIDSVAQERANGKITYLKMGEDINQKARDIISKELKPALSSEIYQAIYKENPDYPITLLNLNFCDFLDETMSK